MSHIPDLAVTDMVQDQVRATPRGISPSRWGACAWTFLHYIALGYPQHPTSQDVSDYASFFASLQFVLPCKACRDHMQEHVVNMPIDNALASGRDALFAWTVQVHNTVNASLGRRQHNLDAMFDHYASGHISAQPRYARLQDGLVGAVVALLLCFACACTCAYTCRSTHRRR